MRCAVLILALLGAVLGASGCQSCVDDSPQPAEQQPTSTDRPVFQGPVKIRPGLVKTPVQVTSPEGGAAPDAGAAGE